MNAPSSATPTKCLMPYQIISQKPNETRQCQRHVPLSKKSMRRTQYSPILVLAKNMIAHFPVKQPSTEVFTTHRVELC